MSAAETILVGPSAIPYSPCAFCENMCLPGELEHCPVLGADCYLCGYCREEAEEAQFERHNAEDYGE